MTGQSSNMTPAPAPAPAPAQCSVGLIKYASHGLKSRHVQPSLSYHQTDRNLRHCPPCSRTHTALLVWNENCCNSKSTIFSNNCCYCSISYLHIGNGITQKSSLYPRCGLHLAAETVDNAIKPSGWAGGGVEVMVLCCILRMGNTLQTGDISIMHLYL